MRSEPNYGVLERLLGSADTFTNCSTSFRFHSEGVVGGSCTASPKDDLLFRHRNVNAETSPSALWQHAAGQRSALSYKDQVQGCSRLCVCTFTDYPRKAMTAGIILQSYSTA